jgi:hypothetical protein
MALAALPAGASANSGSEVASAKRIVIAYIPEHLQLRVQGQTDERHTSPTLPQGARVQPVADSSGGLQWDMWAPEPTPSQQPKFEVEYVPPTPEEEEAQRRKRNIAIGVVVPVVVLFVAGGVIAAVALQDFGAP